MRSKLLVLLAAIAVGLVACNTKQDADATGVPGNSDQQQLVSENEAQQPNSISQTNVAEQSDASAQSSKSPDAVSVPAVPPQSYNTADDSAENKKDNNSKDDATSSLSTSTSTTSPASTSN